MDEWKSAGANDGPSVKLELLKDNVIPMYEREEGRPALLHPS